MFWLSPHSLFHRLLCAWGSFKASNVICSLEIRNLGSLGFCSSHCHAGWLETSQHPSRLLFLGLYQERVQFSPVQLRSHVWLFATPWTAVRQASLSITNSWSLLKLMSIESVMPSNHLIISEFTSNCSFWWFWVILILPLLQEGRN